MKRQLIRFLAMIVTLFVADRAFSQVDACIKVPASHPYPITSKTVYMCKGTYLNLIGVNCLGNTTPFQESYSWINLDNPGTPQPGQNIYIQESGRWELTLTNLVDGSVDKDVLTVQYLPTPTTFLINSNQPQILKCSYDTITLNLVIPAGATNVQWWAEGITGSIASNVNQLKFQAGKIPNTGSAYYSATADYSGNYPGGPFTCQLYDSIFTYSIRTPKVTLPNDTAYCEGNSFNIVAKAIIMPDSVDYGPSGTSFQWNGTGTFVDADDTRPSSSVKGKYKYWAIAKNAFGCQTVDSINVTVNAKPVISISSATTVCMATPFVLNTTITSATGPFDFTWSPAATLNDNKIQSPTVTPQNSTPYSVLVVDKNTGCKNSATQNITVNPGIQVDLPKDTAICAGQSYTISASVNYVPANTPANVSTIDFDWNNSGTFVTGANSKTASNTVGTQKYYVSAKNGTCLSKDSINVTVNPSPVLTPTTNTISICADSKVNLSTPAISTTTGPYTFDWQPAATLDNPTTQSPVASPKGNTVYTLTVTDGPTKCKASATRTVNLFAPITINMAFNDTTICGNDNIKLGSNVTGGVQPFSFVWSPAPVSHSSTSTNDTALIAASTPTTYKLTVTDNNNCSVSDSILVDQLSVTLGGPDTLGIIGDSVKLMPLNKEADGFAYRWKDSTGAVIGTSKIFNAKTTGNYTIEVYNPVTSCFVTTSKEVLFTREIIQKIYIPTAFNPVMADPDNSNLRVYGNNVAENNFIFQVYDIWGQMVYETDSFLEAHSKGWNGSLKNAGQTLHDGVYTYTVRGEFKDGSKFQKTGTSSLLK